MCTQRPTGCGGSYNVHTIVVAPTARLRTRCAAVMRATCKSARLCTQMLCPRSHPHHESPWGASRTAQRTGWAHGPTSCVGPPCQRPIGSRGGAPTLQERRTPTPQSHARTASRPPRPRAALPRAQAAGIPSTAVPCVLLHFVTVARAFDLQICRPARVDARRNSAGHSQCPLFRRGALRQPSPLAGHARSPRRVSAVDVIRSQVSSIGVSGAPAQSSGCPEPIRVPATSLSLTHTARTLAAWARTLKSALWASP